MTAPPEVELDRVSFDRDGQRVLDAVSLRLEPGQRLCLCGPNGAGKTSLLRLIVGLALPVSGEVRLAGRPCRSEADFRRARAAIGFLFQDSDDQLFSPTVVEDVAFGPMNLGTRPDKAMAQARAQLDAFGLLPLADRPVHRLSGGEKRLVCLAGLFVMQPRVLLLDEPTNGLDGAGEDRLIARLQAFQGAMLIVTHDDSLPDRLGAQRLHLQAGHLV